MYSNSFLKTKILIYDFVADSATQIGFTVKFVSVLCLYIKKEKPISYIHENERDGCIPWYM